MRHLASVAGICLGLAAVAIASQAAKGVRDFASLKTDETMEVEFESSGCFNHDLYSFKFHRGNHPQVTIYNKSRGHLGTIPITDADLKALDATLSFYRKNKGSGCTTTDKIVLKRISKTSVSEEEFTDSSCDLLSREHPEHFPDVARRVAGTLRFDELVERAIKLRKKSF